MIKYIFDYLEDPEHGSMGYVYRKKSHKLGNGGLNVATEGRLIAHDLLEHSSIDRIGTIGDELEALGGILYIRGQFGDISRTNEGSRYSSEESIALEVTSLFGYFQNSYRYGIPLHTKPLKSDGDAYIDKVCRLAPKQIMRNYYDDEYTPYTYEQQRIVADFITNSQMFMQSGWNKAHKRFERYGGAVYANNLFWNIAEAVDRFSKWYSGDYRNMIVKIVYKSGQVAAFPEPYPRY